MKWLASALALVLGVVTSRSTQAAPPAHALRVLTYNVEYDNADPAASIDAIATADADIVVLQEITQGWQDALARRFATQYPNQRYHLHARAAGGLAILSKLPIVSRESYASPTPRWFPADRVVVATPFGDLQILNVHLRPAIDQGSWVRGYVTTPPLRLAEIQAYWPHLDPTLPTIIAGDFNEIPSGSAVQFLEAQGLVRAKPRGPSTWHYERVVRGVPVDVLSLDLDHVMLRGLVAHDGQVLDAGTSDHRPVLVTVSPP